MMKTVLYIALTPLLLLASCNDTSHTLRNVSAYKIRKGSLDNHATIRMVYTAGGPSKTEAGLASGYQYLAVERESGDTFRIICNQLYQPDFSRNYLYVSYFSNDPADFALLANDTVPTTQPPRLYDERPPVSKRPEVELPGRVYSSVADTALENRPFPTVFGTFVEFPARIH